MSVTQKLEARLADLQQKFEALQTRVDRLEARAEFRQDEEEPHARLDLHGDETEYWIGARFLPRLGAVLIVLAIAFLAISETSKNAAVDRSIVLLLETMFCLGFIAVGEWRRDESEGFGKTLTAIGSCGLFLTAAGAHFAYHTLSAAGMAAVFALLALLNHGYAVWRNTRLFFGIGATGGVAAMLFPLAEKDYSTGLALYLTVTIAAALACAVRKWMGLAFMGWLSGLAIIAPVVMSDYSRTAIVGGLYLGSLACIGAYVHSNTEEELDIAPVGASLMFFLTGLVGLTIQPGLAAIPNVAGFGLIGMGLALRIYRSNFAARCLFVGAAATMAVIVPLALPPIARSPAFVGVAVLVMFVSPRLDRRLAAAFAAAAFGASVIAYVRWGGRDGAGECPAGCPTRRDRGHGVDVQAFFDRVDQLHDCELMVTPGEVVGGRGSGGGGRDQSLLPANHRVGGLLAGPSGAGVPAAFEPAADLEHRGDARQRDPDPGVRNRHLGRVPARRAGDPRRRHALRRAPLRAGSGVGDREGQGISAGRTTREPLAKPSRPRAGTARPPAAKSHSPSRSGASGPR